MNLHLKVYQETEIYIYKKKKISTKSNKYVEGDAMFLLEAVNNGLKI